MTNKYLKISTMTCCISFPTLAPAATIDLLQKVFKPLIFGVPSGQREAFARGLLACLLFGIDKEANPAQADTETRAMAGLFARAARDNTNAVVICD